MRLFLGVRAKLYDYESIKRAYSPYFRGKWVEEENLHATLYFFGDRDKEEVIEKVKSVDFPHKKIYLKGEGSFGRPPRVLFVNLEENIYLKSHLHLEKLFGKTGRRFQPHVTLIRIKEILNNGYKKLLHKESQKELGYLYPQVTLFKSDLTPKGPIYTPICSF